MKMFLVFLVLAHARSEKLDLTYLPPPGSQYAGGRPGDIQVPLEFPKETYSTTLRPQDYDSGITNPEDYQATIGINRLPPGAVDDSGATLGTNAPFSNFQNAHKVPTTTVSYAFTQTTTHPPTEGFETTIGPIEGTGFPSQDGFSMFQPQEPGSTYQGSFDRPGFEQSQLRGQNPTAGSVTQFPGYFNQPQGSVAIGGNQQAQNRPGGQQNIDQFGRPVISNSGPVSQFPGSTAQPQRFSTINQNRPNFETTGIQYGQQNPTLASIPGRPDNTVGNFPGLPQQNLENIDDIYGQGFNQINQQQQGYNQPTSGVRPIRPFGQTQYQNQTFNQNGLINQPGFVSSTTPPTSFSSTARPSVTYDERGNIIQGSTTPANLPVGVSQNVNDENRYLQQYPESPINRQPVINDNRQNVFQPSSTAAPSSFAPGIQNGQLPSGTSVSPGSYSVPAYPGAQYDNQVGGAPGIYRQRPERPQAEADRNAVILNYENVITPEGFAYSFDTSNGIHADESGTATDGVKAKGSYSYVGDDGKVYSVVYTADENGYQPHGDHLPTPPPIPKAIQEIIEKAKKEKEAGIYHDGSYDDNRYGDKKYQGILSHKPLNNNGVYKSGAVIPDKYETEASIQGTKPRRPLTSTRKPMTTSGDLSDFGEVNQEQSQYDDNEFNDKMPGRNSTQRPLNAVTAVNDKDSGDFIQDGDDENQYIDNLSKRPLKQPNKQYNNIKGTTGTRLDSNRRQPGNKISSEQIEDQTFDNESEEPSYENGISSNRYPNQGISRRPAIKQRPQYDQEDTTMMDTYEYNDGSKRPERPSTSGPFKRPEIITPGNRNQQTFDEYETTRPTGKLPGRRPTNKPFVENDRGSPSDGRYNVYKDSSRPSNKPLEYRDKNDSDKTVEVDGNEEYATTLPSRIRPHGTKLSTTSLPRDEATRRRPVFNPNVQNEHVEYQTEDDQAYVQENTPSQTYGNRRPITSKPTKIYDYHGQNKKTEQVYNEGLPESSYYSTTRPILSTRYEDSQGRPQSSRPQTAVQNNRGQLIIADEESNMPVTKFGQKLMRPSISQENGYKDNVAQFRNNETGYQYIPPQMKFQDDGKRFPVQYTGTTSVPSTKRPPQQNVLYEKNGLKGKPFLTPHVFRDNSSSSDDEYDQEDTKEIIPGKVQNQQNHFNNDYSRYPDVGTSPDQVYGDEIISSTKPPGQFTSSTYTSSPTTGRPLRPQYNQYTQNMPVRRIDQNGIRRPIQGTGGLDDYKYTTGPFKASSTTPMPSTRPYYGSTTPAGQDTGDIYQTPGQETVSSTTGLPTQDPNFEGNYQQNTGEPEYQSTFRPSGTLRPTTDYTDTTAGQRLPGIPSAYPTTARPYQGTQFGNNLPSTTYRPNYTIGANQPSTPAPGTVVDNFGRPIIPGFNSNQNTPGSTPSGQPIRDHTNVRYQSGEPSRDQFRGQQRYRPGTRPGQQVVAPTFQSSTEKVTGEDFSGPKQQQKFDPQTGYYYK